MQLSHQLVFKELLKRAYFLYTTLIEHGTGAHDKILDIWDIFSSRFVYLTEMITWCYTYTYTLWEGTDGSEPQTLILYRNHIREM